MIEERLGFQSPFSTNIQELDTQQFSQTVQKATELIASIQLKEK
jgi:hypothetical protein